jgi:MYXO-CTERM domain-containing protein
VPSLRLLCGLALFFAATMVGACESADPISVGRSQRRIINGIPDTSYPATVALVYQGEEFCSGTLVAPRIVLSAGHCLKETGFKAADISVFFGEVVGSPGTSIKALKWTAHPLYYELSDGTPMNDVSVIVLAEDGPVDPMDWQSIPLPDPTGKTATMVGYGVTDARTQTGDGTRRQVTEIIKGMDSDFIFYGDGRSGTCQGDSGGPTFLADSAVVVAVTSYGDVSCVRGSGATRVDVHAKFINQVITDCTCAARQCGTDCWGTPCGGCPALHVCDSSGQCVPGCAPDCAGKQCGDNGCGGSCGICGTGTACNSAGQCEAVCTPSCAGKQCGPDQCGGSCGSCAPGQSCNDSGQCLTTPSGAALGESCETDDGCASHICLGSSAGTRYCSELCDASGGCKANFSCVPQGERQLCLQQSTQPAQPGSSGGCALAPQGAQPAWPGGAWLLLASAGLLWLTRRRRTGYSAPRSD